jgi:methylthioribose-1-phosphate isomerase
VFSRYRIAPEGVKVRNIAFDVTPHKYVSAIITEKGVFRPSDIKHLLRRNADIDALRLRPHTQRKKAKA